MGWTRLYVQIIGAAVLSASSERVFLEYHFINQPMSWGDAQSYCRLKHWDLATVRDVSDHRDTVDLLGPVAPPDSWIGLRRTATRRWRWSDGSGTLQSAYWRAGEPNNVNGIDWCVTLGSDGQWNDIHCTDPNGFVCYEHDNELNPGMFMVNRTRVRYVHYNGMTTWRSGQSTCRKNHVDLVAATSPEINSAIRGLVAEGRTAWLGLFNDAWEWSDGNDTSYRSWVDGGGSGDCAAVSIENGGFWAAKDCAVKMPFVCEGGLKARKTLVKMQMSTTASLTPEVIMAHLSNQLKTNGVSDFKLSWRRGKDVKIFRQQPAPDPDKKKKNVCVMTRK